MHHNLEDVASVVVYLLLEEVDVEEVVSSGGGGGRGEGGLEGRALLLDLGGLIKGATVNTSFLAKLPEQINVLAFLTHNLLMHSWPLSYFYVITRSVILLFF